MFAVEISAQLARPLEDLSPVKDLALPGTVSDGSGAEAENKEGANEERSKLHNGCE